MLIDYEGLIKLITDTLEFDYFVFLELEMEGISYP